jgi:septum site-determining protein MinC
MLKGTESGILIQISNIEEDLKALELRLKSKMFITKVDFFIYPKDEKYFSQLEALLKEHGFKLTIAKEKSNKSSVKVKDVAEKVETAEVPLMNFFSNFETLMINRTLRSGQRIEHAGNVVVMGDVNAGAEVRADGDICIFGRAKGVLHAGRAGNKEATITALSIQTLQIRIANAFSQTVEPSNNKNSYEKVFLNQNGDLVIEEIER